MYYSDRLKAIYTGISRGMCMHIMFKYTIGEIRICKINSSEGKVTHAGRTNSMTLKIHIRYSN